MTAQPASPNKSSRGRTPLFSPLQVILTIVAARTSFYEGRTDGRRKIKSTLENENGGSIKIKRYFC